jgi:hypothetical protein
MGFKVKEKQYKLKFDDDQEMAGFEVIMLPMSVETVLLLQELGEPRETRGEDREDVRSTMQLVADHMVSWNLLDADDLPVPVSVKALQTLEMSFYRTIVREWDRACAGVPAPLDSGSTSGVSSLEASIPMEPSSPSPES